MSTSKSNSNSNSNSNTHNGNHSNGVNSNFTIEDQREKTGLWFTEEQSTNLRTIINLNAIYARTQSPYQKIDVIETCFGRTLITDGKTQSAECDEFMYHETLVQPSMLLRAMLSSSSSSNFTPKSVLIGGGGELATAREVLRHSSVERCVMVDLDEEVINVSKQYLPTWGNNVTSDKRLELVIGDAHAYIQNTTETFDVIIMDISDPIEAGPGIALYTQEFYQLALTKLSKQGVFITQAGVADSLISHEGLMDSSFAPIVNTLQSVFDCTIPYAIHIPSFQAEWGFVMAFNVLDHDTDEDKLSPEQVVMKVQTMSEDVISKRIDQCVKGGLEALQHYDGCTHRRMFALCKSMRTKLSNDKRIMTKENPVFMY